MFKLKNIVLIITANALLCTTATVYADSTSNWDYPTSRIVKAVKIENQLLMTTSTIQWSADQLKLFQSDDVFRQFFPALVYKVTDADELRSKLMFTNAPGAKFTRKLATYDDGEEIKLSIRDTSRLSNDKSYVFYTAWLHTVEGDSQISFRSLQRYAQPNGTLNDLHKTDDEIATITFDKAEVIDKKYKDYYLPESFNSPFKQYTWREETDDTKVKSYALINSKEELESYKHAAAQSLKFAPSGNKVRFAATFRNNGPSRVDMLVEKYNLTLSQIYAAGIKENKEEYTVSWYDTGLEVMSLMGLQQSGFEKFAITELEGTAYVEDLQKMSQMSNIDVIEIESLGQVPSGLHWLNERYGN
ncbi:hypothetical protein GC102_00515 [Paenibacillus sp. LMG 31460]|uniref:Uncharacterized protein n=1 Tax=Paenibacillus germinis TaxID=2654979 RepID=A0ABX1YWQ1_9BACL|nr:hypothetical protein [Paenibacillus germinis]NOU84271.1 hypothetical protein [Paenibacillus germinis]